MCSNLWTLLLGQYKVHNIVINVHVNVDQIQSILPHHEPTIWIFLKWYFEYKSPYILGNVYPNMLIFFYGI